MTFEAFMGFNLLMGLNPKPSVRDYWRKNPIYHYAPIADKISRDRYPLTEVVLCDGSNPGIPLPEKVPELLAYQAAIVRVEC